MKYTILAASILNSFVFAGTEYISPSDDLSPKFYPEEKGSSTDLSPNFRFTETVVDGSWIRLAYDSTFGGTTMDELFAGDDIFSEQTNITLTAEYEVFNGLALTAKAGFREFSGLQDEFNTRSGFSGGEYGLKYNVFSTENYTAAVYAAFVHNSNSEAGNTQFQEDGFKAGITQAYYLDSANTIFTFDINYIGVSFDSDIADADFNQVTATLGAYTQLTNKWGVGAEVGYYSIDTGAADVNPSLIRTNAFVNYSITDNLDITGGVNYNTGDLDNYSFLTETSGSLALTYNF